MGGSAHDSTSMWSPLADAFRLTNQSHSTNRQNFFKPKSQRIIQTLCELLNGNVQRKLKHENAVLLECLQADGCLFFPNFAILRFPVQGRLLLRDCSNPPMLITGQCRAIRAAVVAPCSGFRTERFIPPSKSLIRTLALSGLPHPFRRSCELPCGISPMPGQFIACLQFLQSRLENGSARFLDRMETQNTERNLQFIVSNSRFLIPPYVSIRGLASMIAFSRCPSFAQ